MSGTLPTILYAFSFNLKTFLGSRYFYFYFPDEERMPKKDHISAENQQKLVRDRNGNEIQTI